MIIDAAQASIQIGEEQKSNRKRKFERGICSKHDFVIRLLISTLIAATYFIILYFQRVGNSNFINYMIDVVESNSRIAIASLTGLNFAQFIL